MKTTFFALVLALLASTSIPASAAAASGNEWTDHCKSKDKIRVVLCQQYARGLADGLTVWQFMSPDTASACIPQAVRAVQLADVAMKYIAANPKSRHEEAGWLLARSFIEAWPCEAE